MKLCHIVVGNSNWMPTEAELLAIKKKFLDANLVDTAVVVTPAGVTYTMTDVGGDPLIEQLKQRLEILSPAKTAKAMFADGYREALADVRALIESVVNPNVESDQEAASRLPDGE